MRDLLFTASLPKDMRRRFDWAVWIKLFDGVLAGLIALVAFGAVSLAAGGAADTRLILALIVTTLLLVVARYVAGAVAMRWLYTGAFQAGMYLRHTLLRHLVRLPLSAFYKLHAGKVAQTLSEDMTWLENQIAFFGPTARAEAATILVLLMGAAVLHWPAALAALGFWALGMITLRKLARTLAVGLRFRSDGMAEAARHFMEYAEGIQVVRAFGDKGDARRAYSTWINVMRDGFRKGIARNTPLAATALGLAMMSVGVGAVAAIVTRPEEGAARVACAIGVLTAALIPARAIIAGAGVKELARVAQDNVSEILGLPEVGDGDVEARKGPARLAFEDVSFSYQEGDMTLQDIGFTAEPGTITAIVGPSGSGKTTLANLMLRFWDPDRGRILLNGRDVRDYSMRSFANRFAPVFQETMLLRDTVEANLRLAQPDASRDAMIAAARAAQIHDTIEALPEGYATKVGPGGQTLSGGERQRVTIARAILKDADIVILDEATSALDPENEREIQLAFEALAQRKTVFVIAHRLSTIVDADQILLLDQGRLSAIGTHEDLLRDAPLYRALWKSHLAIADWRL
ncbi:MAG: ABC transporter ATP-binding protein [Pseudomonadota bacterium]